MTTQLLGDDRTTLVTERFNRFTLTGPEGQPLTFNTADDDGRAWVIDDPTGWEFPEVQMPMDRRPNGHGGFAGQPSYNYRTLTIEGTVTAPSHAALKDARDLLDDALLGHLGVLSRFAAADEDYAPGLWVYPTGTALWRWLDDRAAEFSFVLVAEDPIKSGTPQAYGPVRLSGTEDLGGYPMATATLGTGAVMPWTAAGGSGSGSVVVHVPNPGNQDSHAVYRITGPVPQPIVQLGNGQYVHLQLTLGELDVVEIDTYAGTVLLNGQNRYDAWGPGSTFPLIPARTGVDVRLRSLDSGVDPAAALYVVTAPSWR